MYDEGELLNLYSGRGSKPHDPRPLLKFVVYQHALGKTEPTHWADELASDRNAQWLTFGTHVSRTAMYSFRDRIEPIIEKINAQVVRFSVEQDLIDPKRASLDGTYIAANTSRGKLLNIHKVNKRLKWIEQEIAMHEPSSCLHWTLSTLDDAIRPAWLAKTPTGLRLQLRMYLKAKTKLQELLAVNAKRRSDKRKPVNKIVVSVADSDAVFGRDKDKVYRPLYNVQTVCDLASEMVLSYEVFPQVSDSGTLQTMIGKLNDNNVLIQSLLADAGYPTGEDLAFCNATGLTLYAPWQENSFTAQKQSSRDGNEKFSQSDFQWAPEDKSYVCPNGKTLSFSENKSRQRADGSKVLFELYRADGEACQVCPLSNQCTSSVKGRSVRRDPDQDLIDDLKARMETPEAKLLYGLRGQTVERIYGDFKEHRGARRFRGRGIGRARVQYGLTVLGHNLRIAHRLLQIKISEDGTEKPLKNTA